MNDRIFREYDIRGVFGEGLTLDVTELIGKAYAARLKSIRGREGLKISVGRDVRLSSMALRDALVRGIRAMGVNVVDIGECPTPLQYFSIYHLKLDGGIMVTGSHNPPEYNGFKLSIGRETIHGGEIQGLRRIIEEGRFEPEVVEGRMEAYDIVSAYLDYQLNTFDGLRRALKKRPVRIVTDAGNGTGGLVVPALLRELGCDVVELYTEPDGRFPNHHPDPTVEENLRDLIEAVKRDRGDFGVAYDGDSDRIGVVDEEGRIVWGDQLMIVYARDILHSGMRDASFVGEVKCSQTMYDEIERLGGKAVMWKTGHSLIKSKMKEIGAAMAGEMSGHIFFADRYLGFDDAIYATLRILEIFVNLLSEQPGAKFSALLDGLPKTFSTPEIRMDCADDMKFLVVEELASMIGEVGERIPVRDVVKIDGLRIIFEDGWALVRASNTQPVLVLRFEASDEERLAAMRSIVEDKLSEAVSSIGGSAMGT